MRKSLRRDIIFSVALVLILAVVGLAIGFGVDWGAKGAESNIQDNSNSTTQPADSNATISVTISIDCRNLMKEENWLSLGKNYQNYLQDYKANNGKILTFQTYIVPAGTSVLELLRIVSRDGKVAVSESHGYVRSIANIPEKVCDGKGGWAYAVNDTLPWTTSSADYALREGDRVEWRYTVDMGDIEYA